MLPIKETDEISSEKKEFDEKEGIFKTIIKLNKVLYFFYYK